MAATLRATLDYRTAPFIPSDLIWSTYESMTRRHGWRDPMRQSRVTWWLNEKGFPKMRHGGQKGVPGAIGIPCRFVELSRIDALVPPVLTVKCQPGSSDEMSLPRERMGE